MHGGHGSITQDGLQVGEEGLETSSGARRDSGGEVLGMRLRRIDEDVWVDGVVEWH